MRMRVSNSQRGAILGAIVLLLSANLWAEEKSPEPVTVRVLDRKSVV